MGYVTRMVFTHTLSESYVGINGLFTDILNVLALSELGVGTAFTYALYKPIAEHDIEREKSIMGLLKWMYRAVALFIGAAGLCVIPFLGYLVKDAGDVENIVLIYLIYLLNSVMSYLLVYKKTLVDAHQRSYIGVLSHMIFLMIQYIFQIVVLLTTRKFVLFLSIYLLCTIGNNVCIAKKADSLYPYLRDKDVPPLPKEERQGIVKNIRAMLMHKIGNVVVNNTDNLLLSSMVGLVSVGKYSNYFLIIGSVRQVLDQIFYGITASVGNLGVTEDKGRVKKIFEASFFIGQWLYGFAGICLFQLVNYIVSFSFGEKYLFPSLLVLVLCCNFFVTGMRKATLVFRDSLGLFWHDRYKPLAEAVINLVASILLTLRFGIIGVFFGTFISTMLTSFWIEPFVLYRKKLESPVAPYFIRYVFYSGVVFTAGAITHIVCSRVGGDGIAGFAVNFLLSVTIPNLVFLVCYHRTKEFCFLSNKAVELLKKKRSKEPQEKKEALTTSDEKLFEVLKSALASGQPIPHWEFSADEWDEILRRADRHAVLSIMYDVLTEQELSPAQTDFVTRTARKYVLQNYRLSHYTHQVIEHLKEKGITAIVLKGVSAASCYPTPELRKSGDVDILVPRADQLKAAKEALLEMGIELSEEQNSVHHIAMYSKKTGIEIELHSLLVEPFENSQINKYIKNCQTDILKHVEQRNIIGYDFPVLADGYQAYELLLHMLQHFLHSGFGLKLLCDWVHFWNRPVEESQIQRYLKLVDESGISVFSKMITSVCVIYLGLDENCSLCSHIQSLMSKDEIIGFVKDLLEGEEFGESTRDRLVVMGGTTLIDYVRKFHHITCRNFPKAVKVFLLWPVLWCITLFRFLRNNRRVRGVTTKEILKKAKERSKRIDQLKLFKISGKD